MYTGINTYIQFSEVVNAIKKLWMHFLKESTLSAEHVNI